MARVYDKYYLNRIVEWYFGKIYSFYEGPAIIPWYCNTKEIGYFAVNSKRLKAIPDSKTLFRLFITMTMYQALRDTVIAKRQRDLTLSQCNDLIDLGNIHNAILHHKCLALSHPEIFYKSCNVVKSNQIVDCLTHPGLDCPVKLASLAYGRMGDLGKLAISAVLNHKFYGLFDKNMHIKISINDDATQRAYMLVTEFKKVFRVGSKLATMFVSALSTPGLFPDYTPWYPIIDGNDLVVIDTNVSKGIRILTNSMLPETYEAQGKWIRSNAKVINMSIYGYKLPEYSPRLLQQSLYWFISKSNRLRIKDTCSISKGNCQMCVPQLCPFVKKS
jgi:hypothetical protein